MTHRCRAAAALYLLAGLIPAALSRAGDLDPVLPATFFPSGMLGVQIGSPWTAITQSPAMDRLDCEQRAEAVDLFDEVCFFKTSGRVAGAQIHDGFVVRKGDHVILIGTGITIKNQDDPLAEAVVRDFESQIHAKLQQTGSDVLFVNLPNRRLSPGELQGFSQTAPALLVELDSRGKELEVFYGYLAPVNAFSALAAD